MHIQFEACQVKQGGGVGGLQGWGRYSKKGPTCSCSDLKERTEQRDLQHLDSAAAVENVGARTVGRPELQNSPSAKMSVGFFFSQC